MPTFPSDDDTDDSPLPLEELRLFVSETTFAWLKEADDKESSWNKIQKQIEFFRKQQAADSSQTTNEKRVKYWTSSTTDPNGVGGTDREELNVHPGPDAVGMVQVAYLLSDHHWQGFGNQVWASSRHLANQFSDPEACRQLLLPLTKDRVQFTHHPLTDITVCELGAGAAIPSWTAMKCGAKVVVTDQSVTGRIRSIAEGAARNFQSGGVQHVPTICPYDWGTSTEAVGAKKFDLVFAADCCFMPWFHTELIDSISMLVSNHGMALLAFSLHGNVADEQVWSIVELAQERGFKTEVLPAVQLVPQTRDMQLKQALVHTLRLTRNEQ